ncbi:hypothetical protein [Dongia deserti]|uniref:hypothetical protein n=1 Tax=Dongia deserti TaxID=2268030 RepID=UPI000E6493AE|nr:hypothetical protein [Dongia deserti]
MIAQHPYSSITLRLLAVLAVALGFVFVLASSAAQSASADSSQWIRSQPHWWDHSKAWHKSWHHRRQFRSSRPRIIIGGSGFSFSSPGVVIHRGFTHPGFVSRGFVNPGFVNPGFTHPGFVVRQPSFIVRQPGFIVGRPSFATRHPSFIFERHPHVFKRHHSLHFGKPWWHKRWKHTHWRHAPTGGAPMGLGGARIIAPGMN